ncbi:hypothetical protein OVS_02890 [Mycoplasma ovis str. Michigan]|uniref:Uncharacterized protein n=1 Tax=Mycoplasma ovis str. Michigan TaxID=1415773 RepID=A0ABM5P220_9MOLU|nr:hypothetical protein [Mycoplasma ovis]AHC40370.1 hypothetical protein OVS_02890 [Mycoplasma ovis str. Michigan]
MNRRSKLALAGVGFLLSNGALIPVVNNNFGFTNFSLSDFGGGILHKKDSPAQKNYETPKVELSNNKSTTPSLNLDSSKSNLQTPKLNLENQEENSLKLVSKLSPEKGDATISSSIERIKSEVDREGRVQEVEKQLESQYLSQLKQQLEDTKEKQDQHLKRFQEVKEIINSSSKPTEAVAPRARGRRAAQPQKEPLTQLQRDAIYRMFYLYEKLKTDSQKFSKQLEKEFFNGLEELLKPQAPAKIKSLTPSSKEIQESLKDISWVGEAIKTQKGRDSKSTSFFDPRSWGEWSNNPFRHFFTESEFNSAISQQQQLAQKAEYAEQMQLRMQAGYRGQFLDQFQANMRRIQQQKASTASHIEHKIASKLLEYMGQGLKRT